jgi:hypothetical protein
MTSAPAAAALAAAERMIAGSCPKSWMATGPPLRSSGWMRSSSVQVRSLRWWIACEETISLNAMPAP